MSLPPTCRTTPGRARGPVAALLAVPLAATLAVVVACAALVALGPAAAGTGPGVVRADVPADVPAVPDLHLVTLVGGGTAAGEQSRAELLAAQDRVLAGTDGVTPVYRWTTALNGFAAELTEEQVALLEDDPQVALVEHNDVRPMATLRTTDPRAASPATPPVDARGGAGVVVGVVDSGLEPSHPVFADVPDLGREPRGWQGRCITGEEWPETACSRKVVGADWFVSGFGRERLRTAETLSARDHAGHGTQVASVAAGNAGVTVQLPQDDPASGRTFAGVAPQARVAVYKACWTAPDPEDDGCATADLVTAVDRATADGVDVLTLAVEGATGGVVVDTLDRALLGAAESDVVVVAAAGNDGATSYAAHPVPWVTTVGASTTQVRQSAVRAVGGPRLVGAGRVADALGPAHLVAAARAAAPGASRTEARQCRIGSLDAAAVAGRVVLCERGGNGRVDKSAAVAAADGVGMVLVNRRDQAVRADLHSVPTVHLDRSDGRRLRAWLRRHPEGRVELVPGPGPTSPRRVPAWSPAGDPRGDVLKPDLVGPGTGVLAASAGPAWTLVDGTSIAAAHVAGTAAVLRSRTGWDATRVRSALSTTARPLPGGDGTRVGAGRVDTSGAPPRLVLDVDPAAYRDVLAGRRSAAALNQPSILLSGGRVTATRRVTNTGERAEYFSVRVGGLPQVRVSPVALRLGPGETGSFTLSTTASGPGASDSGALVWRGARGSRTRIPVLLAR